MFSCFGFVGQMTVHVAIPVISSIGEDKLSVWKTVRCGHRMLFRFLETYTWTNASMHGRYIESESKLISWYGHWSVVWGDISLLSINFMLRRKKSYHRELIMLMFNIFQDFTIALHNTIYIVQRSSIPWYKCFFVLYNKTQKHLSINDQTIACCFQSTITKV